VTAALEEATLITGIHALIFSPDADRLRAFFRDVLGFPSVDAGEGWLIFGLPPAELGVHPAMEPADATENAGGAPHNGSSQELWLMCDDIEVTIVELTEKGVEFVGPVSDRGFGRVATIKLPDGGALSLYEPRHPTAIQPL
jgi:catechol 2,3-dioxygenase-like lactoylglutathione lyase family enzyme